MKSKAYITDSNSHECRLWAPALIGLFSAVMSGCTHSASETRTPTPVRTAQVQLISTGSEARYSANIEPNAQVDLVFRSGGYIQSIRQVRGADGRVRSIDTGDWVTRGTVLATVRAEDYIDRRDKARAEVSRIQADLEHAKLSFERTSNLYSSQSATKPEYDQAKAQYDSTQAALASAKASVAESETALNDATVRAPFDGWIIKRSVEIGGLAGPTTPAFTIADTKLVRAVFGVPDNAIARIKLGQKQAINTDVSLDTFVGHVSAISPAADARSRIYSVEISIPNPKNQLKSGMIASLSLNGEALPPSVLAVPLEAVIRDPGNADQFAVLLASGNSDSVTVQARSVELGNSYGNLIQILGGVKAGDRVITAGSNLVKSGDLVRVMQ